jgi:hypothetical protein
MSTNLEKKGLYNQNLMNALQKLGLTTFGDVYYVDPTNGDDDYDGLTEDRAFATLAAAYDATTSNQDDFIVLSAYAAHAVTEMLDVSKNRIHFLSGGHRPGSIGMGARSRVTMGVTTAATDLAVMKNTGVGNTFQGLKFDSSNTKDESLYSVVEAGEYSIYEGCEFYKSTDLDETAAAEVANNGDSAQWVNCTFGSTVNIVADDKIRPNMLLTGGIVSGKKCRDNVIQDCLFLVKAAGTEAVRIYGANATDVERMLLVKNSTFLSNTLGAATPAHAVGFGAAQTQGTVLLQDCASVDHTVMAEASVGIYVAGAVPTFATTGVSVAS